MNCKYIWGSLAFLKVAWFWAHDVTKQYISSSCYFSFWNIRVQSEIESQIDG